MGPDHYFSASPESEERLRSIAVTLAGRECRVFTAAGVFSPDHLDTGTAVLLGNVPPPPPSGELLDLGCGWGPVSLTLAMRSPHATVWAVDVNERALDLVRRNAESLGLENIRAVTPDEVPADLAFHTIWSNPPIRVGKPALHDMLEHWLPRMEPHANGWFVVARHLGSDSLQRWIDGRFAPEFSVSRAAYSKGFRVLRVRRHGTPPTEGIELP